MTPSNQIRCKVTQKPNQQHINRMLDKAKKVRETEIGRSMQPDIYTK